jgi:acyl-CoA thioester hydrolase
MKFEHKFRASRAAIDAQGHVNNVAYVQWIQDVAVAHWRAAASAEQQREIAWVVLRHEIDYLKAAFEGDEITARTWVGEARAATCERFTEILRGFDLLVKARSVWCALNAETGRPKRIDAHLKERFNMS